ncbi:MAG: mechanosensitive ion channel [Pirellulales bacterium]|nr:mechanosensitive ion channel [Pirellulales bacterium]
MRIIMLIVSLLTGILLTVAPLDEKASSAEPQKATTKEQLQAELQAVEKQSQNASNDVNAERARQLGVSQDELRKQVSLLENLADTIKQRITSQKRLHEIRQKIADCEKQIQSLQRNGLESESPYELSQLDSMRDELDTARREAKADKLSLDTSEASEDKADKRLRKAEQDRRQVRDQLKKPADDNVKKPTQWDLALAHLSRQIAQHESMLAKSQLEFSKLETRFNQLKIKLLEEKIALVEKQVSFDRNDLEKHLAELDAQRGKLEDKLKIANSADQANQTQVTNARQALEQATGDDEVRRLTEALIASEALAQASSRGVELLQERIKYIAILKTLWERRFALTGTPSEQELASWQETTESMLEEAQQHREEIERRLQTQRIAKLDIENRLSSQDPAKGDKKHLERRLEAIKSQEKQATEYLADLLDLERLLQRLDAEIKEKRQLDSWDKLWKRFLNMAMGYWQLEVFVIHDQAFRLGTLIRSGAIFCAVLFAAWIVRVVLGRTLLRRLRERSKASKSPIGDAVLIVARRTKPIFVVLVGVYLALRALPLSIILRGFLDSIAIVLVTAQAAIWVTATLRSIIEKTKIRRVEEDPSAASAFGLMSFFGQVAVWSAALLLILANLGYQIGPLLAGLGVGGVAVAFALQSILGDIFCSIAIVLDKPFVIGDFIIVNDMLGTVENIGIKTTRIRSLSGEQIIFSNADLLGSRVRNYKRMYERRVVFTFGVVYETPGDKLGWIPQQVRTIIEEIEQTRFDRAHFKAYGDFSLDFEIVYYVLDPDYNLYMDIQQEINLRLLAAFEQEGISFAYPTREIIMRPAANA